MFDFQKIWVEENTKKKKLEGKRMGRKIENKLKIDKLFLFTTSKSF